MTKSSGRGLSRKAPSPLSPLQIAQLIEEIMGDAISVVLAFSHLRVERESQQDPKHPRSALLELRDMETGTGYRIQVSRINPQQTKSSPLSTQECRSQQEASETSEKECGSA